MRKQAPAVFLFALLGCTLLAANLFASGKGKKVVDISGQPSCQTSSCHAEMGTKEFVHEAASDGDGCTDCHEMPQEGRHSFRLVAEGSELCYECHEDLTDKKYTHDPVEEGGCLECHDPHQSDHPAQLRFPPTAELCFQCHDQEDFEAEGSVHGPVSKGLCLKCHDPHSSNYPQQTKKPVPQLCFDCHDKPQKDPAGTPLPSVKVIYEDKKAQLHQPFAEGKCNQCHQPHSSEGARLLKKEYPPLFYAQFSLEEYALCLGCHKDFAKALTEPRTLSETRFRNGNLNLHFRHVNKEKGRTCRACHHHHGSRNPNLIRQEVPFGKKEVSLVYEKSENGSQCASTCHTRVGYNRYEPTLNALQTTPREGVDATEEDLRKSRERDQKRAAVGPNAKPEKRLQKEGRQ